MNPNATYPVDGYATAASGSVRTDVGLAIGGAAATLIFSIAWLRAYYRNLANVDCSFNRLCVILSVVYSLSSLNVIFGGSMALTRGIGYEGCTISAIVNNFLLQVTIITGIGFFVAILLIRGTCCRFYPSLWFVFAIVTSVINVWICTSVLVKHATPWAKEHGSYFQLYEGYCSYPLKRFETATTLSTDQLELLHLIGTFLLLPLLIIESLAAFCVVRFVLGRKSDWSSERRFILYFRFFSLFLYPLVTMAVATILYFAYGGGSAGKGAIRKLFSVSYGFGGAYFSAVFIHTEGLWASAFSCGKTEYKIGFARVMLALECVAEHGELLGPGSVHDFEDEYGRTDSLTHADRVLYGSASPDRHDDDAVRSEPDLQQLRTSLHLGQADRSTTRTSKASSYQQFTSRPSFQQGQFVNAPEDKAWH